MKDEIKSIFYTKKYIFIILALFVVSAIIGWYFVMSDVDGNYYSDFLDDVEVYGDKEELQKLYDDISKELSPIPGIEMDRNTEKATFLKTIYSFSLKYDLPYDSLVRYGDNSKYNHFHYFFAFSYVMGIFIFLSCSFVGSFYYTNEINSKLGKLLYTSGIKRGKLIAFKYLTSMLLIIAITVILDAVMSVFALIYSDTGAKYCIIYTSNNLYFLNYFQMFLLIIASHLIAILCTYTFTFFLSIVLKNGLICFIGMLLPMIGLLYMGSAISNDFAIFWDMATNGGFINALKSPADSYSIRFEKLLLYIPIMLIPVITVLSCIPFVKKADYSR